MSTTKLQLRNPDGSITWESVRKGIQEWRETQKLKEMSPDTEAKKKAKAQAVRKLQAILEYRGKKPKQSAVAKKLAEIKARQNDKPKQSGVAGKLAQAKNNLKNRLDE